MAELEQNPNCDAAQDERERQEDELVRRYNVAAEPILQDLRDIGYEVDRIGDLRHTILPEKGPYKDAVPILMKWLPKVGYDALKEDIVRTLSVPWAKEAAPLLISEFRRAQPDGLRWAIGNALSVVATPYVFTDLVDLVRNKEFGRDREMLAYALAQVKTEKSVGVLVELLSDEEMAGHALAALVKQKAAVPRRLVEPFTSHPKAWVRREAKKLLKYCR